MIFENEKTKEKISIEIFNSAKQTSVNLDEKKSVEEVPSEKPIPRFSLAKLLISEIEKDSIIKNSDSNKQINNLEIVNKKITENETNSDNNNKLNVKNKSILNISPTNSPKKGSRISSFAARTSKQLNIVLSDRKSKFNDKKTEKKEEKNIKKSKILDLENQK